MSSYEDRPFYDTGFTTPERAEELHVERLEKQKIDKITDDIARRVQRKPRKHSRVRDFESDRDHVDEMAALPPDFVDEPYDGEPMVDPRSEALVLARRALTKSMAEKLGGADSIRYRIWLERYNREHPLPGFDQPKGA